MPTIERRTIGIRERFRILTKSGFKCHWCGKPSAQCQIEIDHVVPISKGGSDTEDNLVAACLECNRGKSDVLLDGVPTSAPAQFLLVDNGNRGFYRDSPTITAFDDVWRYPDGDLVFWQPDGECIGKVDTGYLLENDDDARYWVAGMPVGEAVKQKVFPIKTLKKWPCHG